MDTDINIERETHIRISDILVPNGTYPVLSSFEISKPNYMVEYTEGIESGSMSLDRILVDDKIKFGKIHAAKFEVRLHTDDSTDITGKEISVWQIENDEPVYLFDGIIYSAKQNKTDYYRNIIAYDKAYVLSQTDVTTWWNDYIERFPNNDLSTAIYALTWCFGIDINGTEMNTIVGKLYALPNHGILTTNEKMKFSKISFTSLLEYLLAPLNVIPYILPTFTLRYYTEDSTKVYVHCVSEIRLFSFSSSYVDIRDNVDINSSEFSDTVVTIPIGVKYLNEDGTTLKYVYSESDAVVYTYNPILTGISSTDITKLCSNSWQNLNNIYAYNPAKIKLIVSDYSIPLGALLYVASGVFTYNFETILSSAVLIEEECDCSSEEAPFLNETDDNSLNSDVQLESSTVEYALQEDLDLLENEVGTIDNTLTNAQVNIANLNTSVSTIESDISDIQSDVSTLQSDLSNTQSDLSNHLADTNNPHAVTYDQVGAAPEVHTHDEFDNDLAILGDLLINNGVIAIKSDSYFAELFNPEYMRWKELPLTENAVAYTAGGYNFPMYRRVGDRVDIIGAVTVTIPADNLALVVANLPTGYRPFNAVSVVQTSNAVYQDAFFARVGYFANGEIRIVWGARVDGNQPTQVNIYLNTSYYIANGVLQIIKHPEDVTAQVGETAQFTVRALGEERTYKWQTSTNGGSSWINSSFISSTTATLSIPVTAARNGYMYRCIVTSADGKHLVTSEAATLTVTE